jgi:bacterioferritin-associated ferredoxin
MHLPDQPRSRKKTSEIICLCNNVDRESIEKAIRDGAQDLNEIFDKTTAGVGPCGGSCRRKLGPLLDHFLLTGEFLPPEPPKNKKSRHEKV